MSIMNTKFIKGDWGMKTSARQERALKEESLQVAHLALQIENWKAARPEFASRPICGNFRRFSGWETNQKGNFEVKIKPELNRIKLELNQIKPRARASERLSGGLIEGVHPPPPSLWRTRSPRPIRLRPTTARPASRVRLRGRERRRGGAGAFELSKLGQVRHIIS